MPAPTNRIVLIDRPQSPQSLIYGGAVLPLSGTDDLLALNAANVTLGSDFLSRINSDLRETKGWSYGVRGGVNTLEHRVPYIVNAPVQANRTGESVAALIAQYDRFLADRRRHAARAGADDQRQHPVAGRRLRNLGPDPGRPALQRPVRPSRRLSGDPGQPHPRADGRPDGRRRPPGHPARPVRLGRGRRRLGGPPAAGRAGPAGGGALGRSVSEDHHPSLKRKGAASDRRPFLLPGMTGTRRLQQAADHRIRRKAHIGSRCRSAHSRRAMASIAFVGAGPTTLYALNALL